MSLAKWVTGELENERQSDIRTPLGRPQRWLSSLGLKTSEKEYNIKTNKLIIEIFKLKGKNQNPNDPKIYWINLFSSKF